jgi:hypothetical protein
MTAICTSKQNNFIDNFLLQMRIKNATRTLPPLMNLPHHLRQCKIRRPATNSTSTAHLAALTLQIRHGGHSGSLRSNSCGSPECSNRRQNSAASVEVDSCSGIVRRHRACLDAVKIADDAPEVSHQDRSCILACNREPGDFHEGSELNWFVLGKDDGAVELGFVRRIVKIIVHGID